MSDKYIQTPVCDEHPDDIARAICKHHNKLLCFSCALEKAKSLECSITELRKLSCEQDTALYEGLLVRQIASKKKRLIEGHENKTEEMKNTLKKQITDFHEQLMTRLNKTKDDSLSLLEKHADRIITQNKHTKIQLEKFERVTAENVEKLSAKSSSDLSEIQLTLHEVKQKLLTDVPDVESHLEGNFQADDGLKDILSISGFTLGKVFLISQDRYEHVTDSINEESTLKKVNDTEENTYFVSKKESAISSSDEVIYSQTVTGKGKQTIKEDAAAEDYSQIPQEESNDNMSQNGKRKSKPWVLPPFLRRKKSDSKKQDNDTETNANLHDIKDSPAKQNAAQDIYQDTSLHTQEYNQLRNLINKAVPIDATAFQARKNS